MVDPFQPILLWHSSDHAPGADADRPLYAFEYEDLLGQARTALARRKASYPEMIQRKRIEPDLADRDIAAWELLVAEWTWLVEGPDAEGAKLPPRGSLGDRLAAVDLALARVQHELDRGRRDFDLLRQSHLNQALRWHLLRLKDGAPAVHHFVDITRRLRAAPEPAPEQPQPHQQEAA